MSEETKKGLAECEYEVPTEIQKETLTLGLRGLDILGKIESFDIIYFIIWVKLQRNLNLQSLIFRYILTYIFFKFASWIV